MATCFALTATLAVAYCIADVAMVGATEPPVLESKIVLGQVVGRIDHMGIDLPRERLLVAELGNYTLALVDLREGKLLKQIAGLREPQGVAYAKNPDLIYVSNARDGTVVLFKGADLTRAGEVAFGSDADNIRTDGPDRLIVGYGNGALGVFEAASGKKLANLPMAAHPEAFEVDLARDRIYVNLLESHRVGVVERTSGREVARWGLPAAGGNFPMALDAAGGRLFVGYRTPPLIATFDTSTGAALGQVASCGDADDLYYDTKRKRIYVSCGEGFLAVFDASRVGLAEMTRVRTQTGARTSLFAPELDRLYVAAPEQSSNPASIWVFRLN